MSKERLIRFTGVPHDGKPWPKDAPWQLSPDGDPYKALMIVDGNEEIVRSLSDSAACCHYHLCDEDDRECLKTWRIND